MHDSISKSALGLLLVFAIACALPVSQSIAQRFAPGDGLSLGGQQEPAGNIVTLSSEFKIKKDSREGMLYLKAEVGDQWHIYSITQSPGGPIPSKIKVAESSDFKLTGPFKPDAEPEVDDSKEIFDVALEEHYSDVIWSAPFQIGENVDPEKLKIELTYTGQGCLDTGFCKRIPATGSTAGFAGLVDSFGPVAEQADTPEETKPTPPTPYRPKASHITWSSQVVVPADADKIIKPGDKVYLELTAEPEDGYHIYAWQRENTSEVRSTLIVLTTDNGWKTLPPEPSSEPEEHDDLGYSAHHDPVTWSIGINIPEDAENKNYTLEGLVAFHTCFAKGCDRPDGAKFSVTLPVGTATAPIPVEMSANLPLSKAYSSVEQAVKESIKRQESAVKPDDDSAENSDKSAKILRDSPEAIAEMASLYDPTEKIKYLTLAELDDNPPGTLSSSVVRQSKTTLITAMIGAFIGGMLLNLMPCVFPVLGLKIMGFVEQAGTDSSKIRIHGIVFTLGLLVSMWILAGFILMLKQVFEQSVSWGAQLGNPYFVAGIIVLLFLLGLNMAGVFEIGTSLTRVGGSVQGKKGYSSSFLSGILTTLIATPCSGPFLGAAMSYTFAQTAVIAMFLFTVFALGIGFPYIVLTFFPALIHKLPRPGEWMHTFKVLMAFALFATVAFFMQTFGGQTGANGMSWMIMALVVLALAAFIYGKWSPAYVKPAKRVILGFLLPAAIALGGGWMCYGAASNKPDVTISDSFSMQHGLTWEKWNPGKISYMLKKKPAIIYVDYTANWCLTCKINKSAIFSDPRVLARLDELGVRLVKVDFTASDEVHDAELERTDRSLIPVNFVYPPNYPEEPAVLMDGVITPGNVLTVLDRMEKIRDMMPEK